MTKLTKIQRLIKKLGLDMEMVTSDKQTTIIVETKENVRVIFMAYHSEETGRKTMAIVWNEIGNQANCDFALHLKTQNEMIDVFNTRVETFRIKTRLQKIGFKITERDGYINAHRSRIAFRNEGLTSVREYVKIYSAHVDYTIYKCVDGSWNKTIDLGLDRLRFVNEVVKNNVEDYTI